MTTVQHRRMFVHLTDQFAALIRERRALEPVHRTVHSAVKNPYSKEMRDLNTRWHAHLTHLRAAARQARGDGVRKSTVIRWLEDVDTWKAIKALIADIEHDVV